MHRLARSAVITVVAATTLGGCATLITSMLPDRTHYTEKQLDAFPAQDRGPAIC